MAAEMGAGEAFPHALERRDGLLAVDARHHDHELLASPAGEEIAVAERALRRLREHAQRPVAGLVTVLVVQLLEVVEVGDRDARTARAAGSARAAASRACGG